MTDDRATILKRRAFFVTSAVAALGSCARSAPPADPATNPVVTVPRAEPDAGENETDAALPGPGRDAGRLGQLPPLDIPAGVSETARKRYERLADVMTRAYAILGEIDAELPSCSILAPDCAPKYRSVAEKIHDLDGLFQRFFVCGGGSSEEAKAYAERQAAHHDRYLEWRGRIEAELENLIEAGGPAARARWDAERRAAYAAAPFPCLKFACPDW